MLIRIQSLILLFFSVCLFAMHAQAVTRDELINKVFEAGKIIKDQGLENGIKQIEDTKGAFVWNNNVNYLFLMNIKGKMLAHPFKPKLKDFEHLLDYADVDGKRFFIDFVKIANSKNGMGWVKYMWPIPGQEKSTQKYTFIYRIPDTDYFVGSGLYVIKPGEYY